MEDNNIQVDEDVNDINQHIPEDDKLHQFLERIKNMSDEERNMLLANLASANSVNPNNNRYNRVTSRQLLQQKLRNKLQQQKNDRTSKQVMKLKEKRHQEKIKELNKSNNSS